MTRKRAMDNTQHAMRGIQRTTDTIERSACKIEHATDISVAEHDIIACTNQNATDNAQRMKHTISNADPTHTA